MAILWYPYVKIRKKVIILSILSKLAIPTSTFWTIKSKPPWVMRQMSTFWNHNKEYFHMLKVEQNQRTFILPPPPALNISKTALRIFLIFCMKLVHHKGTKVTEPDFWKKILGGRKWGKTPIFGAFLMFFVHISKTALRILTKFCVWTVLIDT